MLRVYFLDANIFLRLLIREDDKVYQKCYKLIEIVKSGKIKAVTSQLVLAEIAWTLSSYYKYPREKVALALEGIVNLNNLRLIDRYQTSLGIRLYRERSVKYIDAILASQKNLQNRDWVVVSYDKDFDTLGVERKEPDKIH